MTLNPFQQFFIILSLKIFLILSIIYYFLQAQKKSASLTQIANRIDNCSNDQSDTVQNALDFISQNTNGNPLIIKRYCQNAELRVESTPFPYNKKPLSSLLLPSICLIIGTLILFFFQTDEMIKTFKLFRANSIQEQVYQKHIEVKPGNLDIARNSNITIEILNPEKELKYSLWTSSGAQWKKEDLLNHYKMLYNIDQNFRYYIRSQHGQSDTFFVHIIDEPIVKNMNVKINYPAYTGLKSEYRPNTDGNFSVLQGSSVSLDIETDETVNQASIVFNDKSFSQLKKIGKKNWETQFKALSSFSYHFNLTNKLNVTSKPVPRNITVIPDRAPEIQITYPARDTILPQNLKYSISFMANDDFNLRNLKIFYQVNNQINKDVLIKKNTETSLLEMNYFLDLDEFFLLPGDQITYWLEIEDNAPIPQKASTKKYILKFPSMEEIFENNEEIEKSNKDNLTKALEESKKLQDEFEKKRRELLRKQEPNWDDKKEVQQMAKKQENISEMVDNVAKEYQKMINDLDKNQALNQDLLQKMQKIQEIMEEINTPELQKMMQDLQKNLNSMNPEALKKTMENFKFSMEDYAEKLQQTLELLESVKKEMSVQKLTEMSKELEKMQSGLNDKTDQAKNTKDLANEQKAINEKLNKLMEEMDKSKDLFNSDKDQDNKKQLDEMMDDIKKEGLKQDMDSALEQMEQNQKSNAQKMQKSSLQKMAKLSAKLDKMKSGMGGSDAQEMMEILQATIRRLLLFSKLHENLNNQYTHDPFPIMQEMIANYEGIQLSLQNLYSVPQILLMLGQKFFYDTNETQKSYRDFFNEVKENRLFNTKKIMSDIQKGINLMVFDLIQAMNNMQGGGGGGGGMQSLMQQLQQMGQEQMAMNMMTQSMMQQMMGQGNQMSQQTRQQMQRLASDEQRLADNLKRTLQTNPEAQKQTQQVNKLIEELEAISKQLKQGRLDQNILDRQNQIMSKLLDIEKSVQKREFSQKRKGETNFNEDWNAPESVKERFKDQQRKVQLQEDIKKYSPEYQELIREYLKKINE